MTPEQKKLAGITETHRWVIYFASNAHCPDGGVTSVIAPTAADALTMAAIGFAYRDTVVKRIEYRGAVEIDNQGNLIP